MNLYRVRIADCTTSPTKTYLLHGARLYATRLGARRAAELWEKRHPKHVRIETERVTVAEIESSAKR